jgi:hypothetical protein
MIDRKKTCITCHEPKLLEEFHYKNKAKGTRQERCMSCAKEYSKKHYLKHREARLEHINERQTAMRAENKKVYHEFLGLGKCVVCGEGDVRSLTSNVSKEDITFRTTDDLKVILKTGIIKCLNCTSKDT